jgi:hypothetical protein
MELRDRISHPYPDLPLYGKQDYDNFRTEKHNQNLFFFKFHHDPHYYLLVLFSGDLKEFQMIYYSPYITTLLPIFIHAMLMLYNHLLLLS